MLRFKKMCMPNHASVFLKEHSRGWCCAVLGSREGLESRWEGNYFSWIPFGMVWIFSRMLVIFLIENNLAKNHYQKYLLKQTKKCLWYVKLKPAGYKNKCRWFSNFFCLCLYWKKTKTRESTSGILNGRITVAFYFLICCWIAFSTMTK